MKNKSSRIRLIEFKITSCLEGSYNEYHLLREFPKKDYINYRQRCSNIPLFENDDRDRDIYVDFKTKKLWIRTGETFKVDEFEKKAIELSLERGINIDTKPSEDLVSLKILKDTLVEWWCK